MSQALKQQFDAPRLQQEADATPKFQAYQAPKEEQTIQFEELFFFAQLSAFCVLTVALSFFLLASKVLALLAVPVAMLLGAGLVVGIRTLITRLI